MSSDNLKKRPKGHRFLPGNQAAKKKQSPSGEVLQQPKFFNDDSRVEDYLSDVDLEPSGVQLRSSAAQIQNEMRLLHLEKNNLMWNTAFREHSLTNCDKPDFTQGREIRWGIVVQQSLKCNFCSYTSPLFKLYNEEETQGKRGRKAAAVNISFQIALQDTAIANTKGRTLLSALDLCVPDRKTMDETAARVSQQMEVVAEAGMKAKRDEVTSNGQKPIQLGADTRYNCSRPASSRRTGLPLTTQAITIAVEHNTPNRYIVGTYTQNKMCRKCPPTANCTGSHEGCTANVHKFESLSEKKAGEVIGKQLADQGITVSFVTTDGDGKFVAGVQSVSENEVVRLADPVHLGQTQVKQGRKTEWSKQLFPEATTIVARDQCKNALSIDLKNRSFAVLHEAHKKHKHEKKQKLSKIKTDCQKSVDAVLSCYKGDCSECSRASTACEGGQSSNNWITNSKHLQEHRLGPLNLSPSDEIPARAILEKVLSPDAVEKTRHLTDTQLNEALNRALSSNCPKTVKMVKTLKGRVARLVEKRNFGPGCATLRINKKLKLPISEGQKAFLKKQQKLYMYMRIYQRRSRNRARRVRRDAMIRQLRKAWGTPSTPSDYCKDQLDHNYPKPVVSRPHHTTNILISYIKTYS